jgi:hypothetical protein
MRAFRPSSFDRPDSPEITVVRARDRAVRIPVYAERAKDGKPLFEVPRDVPVSVNKTPGKVGAGSKG